MGSAIFFGGAPSAGPLPFFFTSACASSLPFQICQCAMRYSAIAEASTMRYPIHSSAVQEPLALCSSYTDYRIEYNRIEDVFSLKPLHNTHDRRVI